jgi:hypothetical protein
MVVAAEAGHGGPFLIGGELAGLVVEGLDFLRDGYVFVGDSALGAAGVDHGHVERSMPERGGDGFQAHASVDRLGGPTM